MRLTLASSRRARGPTPTGAVATITNELPRFHGSGTSGRRRGRAPAVAVGEAAAYAALRLTDGDRANRAVFGSAPQDHCHGGSSPSKEPEDGVESPFGLVSRGLRRRASGSDFLRELPI